jgi:hypothetical protein
MNVFWNERLFNRIQSNINPPNSITFLYFVLSKDRVCLERFFYNRSIEFSHCSMHYPFLTAAGITAFLVLLPLRSTYAAIVTQGLELTVDNITRESFTDQPGPTIGVKGIGSFTYDDSQIQYRAPSDRYIFPTGYYLDEPNGVSLNFFGRTYNRVSSLGFSGRVGTYVSFARSSSGAFTPQDFQFTAEQSPDTSGASILMIRSDRFSYTGDYGWGSGNTRLTEQSEAVPEPFNPEIVSVFALGLGWAFQRRRSRIRRSALSCAEGSLLGSALRGRSLLLKGRKR